MTALNLLLLLLFSSSVSSQQQETVIILSENGEFIENVVVYNLSNRTFNYTNDKGKAPLNFGAKTDSILIEIPGYKSEHLIVEEILSNGNKVKLKPHIVELDEVNIFTSIQSKQSDEKKSLRSKKKYYTELVSSGSSIVSTYTHSGCSSNKLQALTFYIDKSKMKKNDSIFLRPLILLEDNGELRNLLKTPYSIFVNKNKTEEVLLSFKKSPIEFLEGKTYLLGFELINRSNRKEKISFRAANVKNSYSLVKRDPVAEWMKLTNGLGGFSIDYDVYFNSCNSKKN